MSRTSKRVMYVGFWRMSRVARGVTPRNDSITNFAALWPCSMCCRSRVWGRLQFALSPLALVDLLAILPFWMRTFGAFDARALRALRLLRLLRVLKLGRYSRSMQLFAAVFRRRGADLVSAAIVIAVLLVVASALIYAAEHAAQVKRLVAAWTPARCCAPAVCR